MSESNQQPPRRQISEISHLFLSNVRNAADNGSARPRRTPPGGKPPIDVPEPSNLEPQHSIDMSPEEFERAFGKSQPMMDEIDHDLPARRRVSAIIGSHLNGQLVHRASDYAAHLASLGSRIGMICLDAGELRVMLFERAIDDVEECSKQTPDVLDARLMTEALHELNTDVDRWLLVVPEPRRAEARRLLDQCDDWVLLATCDHDGVVASYRTLKAFAEQSRPRLSLALLDAASLAKAEQVWSKLASVCRQFLDWPIAFEPPVEASSAVRGSLVLWCSGTTDKAQLANAPQWRVMDEFLKLTGEIDLGHEDPMDELRMNDETELPLDVEPEVTSSEPEMEQTMTTTLKMPQAAVAMHANAMPATNEIDDVIELPAGASVLSAILAGDANFMSAPIEPPACPGAKIAVSRDRALTLISSAGQGLSGLNAIVSAWKWLGENRKLIAMALPQMSIDTNIEPRLMLLIDHADANAESLKPIVAHQQVSVRVYRKLKWGGRTGLLLDAA